MIEGAVKNLQGGSDFVSSTNQAFADVSQSVSKAAELVAEIAAASKEQAGGTDQVNSAVAEMEKVVQRNASHAEESASASEEMIWINTAVWIIIRALLGILRIWPGIGHSPLQASLMKSQKSD